MNCLLRAPSSPRTTPKAIRIKNSHPSHGGYHAHFADQPQTEPFPAPTARSAGVDYLYSTWYGFLAPAKTPQDVLEKLGAAFVAAADDPEVQAKVRSQGIAPKVRTRTEFDAYIREDTKVLTPVIERIVRDTR